MNNIQANRKIKTITCHDVNNFGASLQAYALMKYLQLLGNEVEIIDYKPDYLSFNLWAIGEKWKRNIILRLLFYSYVVPQRLLLKSRRRKFDSFKTEKLIVTAKRYNSVDDLRNDPPPADIYIAGSDQIWNTSHQNGKDPAFYLDFAPSSSVRASYAASFSVTQIPDDLAGFVSSGLRKFDAISVREMSGLQILKKLGIEGVVVLDPVFLLEREVWKQMTEQKQGEKYVFVYDQENNPLIRETAKQIARERNLKIYAIKSLYPMSYANRKIKDAGPCEFLNLIRNCEVFLTNSFHGTAFSLIFEREFFTFNRTHEKVNSRMADLLGMVGLSDRIVEEPKSISRMETIDYRKVNSILLDKVKFSREYIDTVLKTKRDK